MKRAAQISGFALLLLLGGGGTVVEAHPAAPTPEPVVAIPVAPPSAAEWIADPTRSLAAPIAAVTGILLAAGLFGRSRRLTTLAFLALFAVFAAESSLHAVHHVGDPSGAALCQVLGVSQHLTGAACDTRVSIDVEDAGPTVLTPVVSRLADPGLRPDQGRAPPVVSA